MTPDELRTRMAALPEPPADSHPPLWDYWRHDLWQRVTSGEDPNGFMGWPCIYHTMLQNHWPEVVKSEVAEMTGGFNAGLNRVAAIPDLSHLSDEAESWQALTLGAHSLTRVRFSRNLAHQMYHLHKWHKVTGKRVADLNSIVEFGGGYGAMALVARRLGFKGKYTIIDLPEFLLLQEYFLSNTTDASTDGRGGYLFSRQLLSGLKDQAADLLIAGYSLSETDYAERDQFLWNYPANSHLLWYSNQFVDYENIPYFQERLPRMYPDITWEHWRADHMPPETWYSVGWSE